MEENIPHENIKLESKIKIEIRIVYFKTVSNWF